MYKMIPRFKEKEPPASTHTYTHRHTYKDWSGHKIFPVVMSRE